MRAIFDYVDLPCPCCHGASFDHLGYRGGRAHRFGLGECVSIVRCRTCSHIYPQPMPKLKTADDGYKSSDEYFRGHDAERKINHYKVLLSDLAGRIRGTDCRILDVGCGRGELLFAAKTLGLTAVGVETSAEFAQFARARYGIKVDNSTLENAGYGSASFDIAMLAGVVEHLYTPRETLGEVCRVLKRGGLLWLDAPNELSLFSRAANLYIRTKGKDWTCHLSPTFPPYHVQGFTTKSVKYLLSAAGFEPIDLRVFPMGTWPHVNTSLLAQFVKCAERVVHAIERLTNTGSFMEMLARKTSHAEGSAARYY